jgi:hypothetical protein
VSLTENNGRPANLTNLKVRLAKSLAVHSGISSQGEHFLARLALEASLVVDSTVNGNLLGGVNTLLALDATLSTSTKLRHVFRFKGGKRTQRFSRGCGGLVSKKKKEKKEWHFGWRKSSKECV